MPAPRCHAFQGLPLHARGAEFGGRQSSNHWLDCEFSVPRRTIRKKVIETNWHPPETRIISLTITEGGYYIDQVDRGIQREAP